MRRRQGEFKARSPRRRLKQWSSCYTEHGGSDSMPSRPNPVPAVKLLRKPNVRWSVLDDAAFEKLLAAVESQLKPIILFAYDTGMRLRVIGLRWSQVNLKLGVTDRAFSKHFQAFRSLHKRSASRLPGSGRPDHVAWLATPLRWRWGCRRANP
jgi:integrase